MGYQVYDVGRCAWRGHVTHILPLFQNGTRKAACGASPLDWSYEGQLRDWLTLPQSEPVTCVKCRPFLPNPQNIALHGQEGKDG